MISYRDMCYEENKSDGMESQGVRGNVSWEGFSEKVYLSKDLTEKRK